MALRHSDDLPQDRETWEGRIKKRKGILDEARKKGDTKTAEMYEERVDRALDNYKRDVLDS